MLHYDNVDRHQKVFFTAHWNAGPGDAGAVQLVVGYTGSSNNFMF